MGLFGTFPFGEPVLPVCQMDRERKTVFVLGVYASAVHARWEAPGDLRGIRALAVASEPEIFWRGQNAREIISRLSLPAGAGKLFPAAQSLNGPSGRALDERYLEPLGLTRSKAWLCDLVPHSCMNQRQHRALKERYLPMMKTLGLPKPDWPPVPRELSDARRRSQIEAELRESEAAVIVTLGDQPLRWFTRFYGSRSRLRDYGDAKSDYGRLHHIRIGEQQLKLLPLVHPRQAGRLGTHSSDWARLHHHWVHAVAPTVLELIS